MDYVVGDGEQYVCLTGVPPGPKKPKFLRLTPKEVTRFTSAGAKGRYDLLVWMLILNGLRVTRQRELKLSPKWWEFSGLTSRQVYDSVAHLTEIRLIAANRTRGRSPVVSIREESSLLHQKEN